MMLVMLEYILCKVVFHLNISLEIFADLNYFMCLECVNIRFLHSFCTLCIKPLLDFYWSVPYLHSGKSKSFNFFL